MRKFIQLAIASGVCLLLVACSQDSNNLTGAGSSFIYPVLSIWAKDYAAKTNTRINYQAIGSGGGLQQIYSHTVDFSASDMPLTLKELQQHKLQQFPMITGGIVMAVNIPNIKNDALVLNGTTLEKIYMGDIKYWDNATLKKLNPGVKLPHHIIVTVHRADGSGTTFNFTNYLSKISPDWQSHIGANTVVAWPGNGIGAKGNAGVATQIMQTQYSIGYVGYAYANQNHMTVTKMENKSGRIVSASSKTFATAAKNAKWNAANGFYLILTNQPGENSWPMVATTFVLVPQQARSAKVKQEVFDFFKWCYETGRPAAHKLDFVAIPKPVYQHIVKTF